MRHVWSVLCQDAVIDRDSNAVSLFKCLAGFAAKFIGPELPTDMPAFCKLATLWIRSDVLVPEKVLSRIRYLTPQGESVNEVTHEVDLSVHVRSRNVLSLQGLPYRGDGEYEFVVETQDDDEWHIAVRVPVQIALEHELPSSTH